MLFALSPNSPRCDVFRELNTELLYFLETSILQSVFDRHLFTNTGVGTACWNNTQVNNPQAKSKLTRDKFESLHTELHNEVESSRRRLYEVALNNQVLNDFFASPNRDLLSFLSSNTLRELKALTTHLYCSTKSLQGVIRACESDINQHFEAFRNTEGYVCKCCGMQQLSAVRANIPEEQQWRSDYDHQLCKSKYPLFSVHPDNLIPLCDICNQDAKKAKDLFTNPQGQLRHFFYPYSESAHAYIELELTALDDPEPIISVKWSTTEPATVEKLDAWDEVYQIKNLVEGKLRSFELCILDEINPIDFCHLNSQIRDKARPLHTSTLARKEWAFWFNKLFFLLSQVDLSAFWEKSQFSAEQGKEGGEYIMGLSL